MRLLTETRERWRRMLGRRRALVGINLRNVGYVYHHNPRRNYPQADDKILAKQRMQAAGVPVPETLASCRGLFEVEGVCASLAEQRDFVIKPCNGSGGNGILVVGEPCGDAAWRTPSGRELHLDEIRQHLANIVFGAFSKGLDDSALVERLIFPHALFARLWNQGLCDVRVITLCAQPAMAMLRVPTRRSEGRANLHQGGLGLAIDIERGVTTRAFSRGHELSHHPESGAELLGLQIPRWPELLNVARRAARSVELGYLGVDIVVDRDRGPLVLEVNARPGLEIQNVNGRGLRPALDEASA